MRAAAIIPACNEEADIAKTIESLRDQTVPLLTILVVANNCTDSTAEVARRAGRKSWRCRTTLSVKPVP